MSFPTARGGEGKKAGVYVKLADLIDDNPKTTVGEALKAIQTDVSEVSSDPVAIRYALYHFMMAKRTKAAVK